METILASSTSIIIYCPSLGAISNTYFKILYFSKFMCHKSGSKCVWTMRTLVFLSEPQQRILPQYLAPLHQHSGLTSLKRFQCLILRLYCEMVDSHCSSSMKFPVFSASLTLFTSAWTLEPASITSGTRRHTISVISTMVADKKNTSHTAAVGIPLVRRRMLRLDWNYQLFSL